MDSILLLFLISIILFYSKYYHTFLKEISFDLINKNNDINKNNNLILENKKKIIKSKVKIKKKIKRKIRIFNENNKKLDIENEQDKIKVFDANSKTNELFFPKEKIIHELNPLSGNNILEYNDSELNELPYEDALKYDKRTYIQYYISLLKINHLIIFSFCSNKDYNSRILKILLFFFSFASELSINALFFNDDTMHNIYKDQGSYDASYQIAQIIYSSLISTIITTLIKYLSLSENELLNLKEEMRKNSNNINEMIKKLYKKLKIKFALFFIITPIILFVFWFYITCFCGIYKNTQFHLIIDTIFSFLTSFIFPFVTSLVPGIFRKFALNSEKKDNKYLYKFSQFIENI